jgi:hypothetical protein
MIVYMYVLYVCMYCMCVCMYVCMVYGCRMFYVCCLHTNIQHIFVCMSWCGDVIAMPKDLSNVKRDLGSGILNIASSAAKQGRDCEAAHRCAAGECCNDSHHCHHPQESQSESEQGKGVFFVFVLKVSCVFVPILGFQ